MTHLDKFGSAVYFTLSLKDVASKTSLHAAPACCFLKYRQHALWYVTFYSTLFNNNNKALIYFHWTPTYSSSSLISPSCGVTYIYILILYTCSYCCCCAAGVMESSSVFSCRRSWRTGSWRWGGRLGRLNRRCRSCWTPYRSPGPARRCCTGRRSSPSSTRPSPSSSPTHKHYCLDQISSSSLLLFINFGFCKVQTIQKAVHCIFSSSQIINHFNFSKYIYFAIHLDTIYI